MSSWSFPRFPTRKTPTQPTVTNSHYSSAQDARPLTDQSHTSSSARWQRRTSHSLSNQPAPQASYTSGTHLSGSSRANKNALRRQPPKFSDYSTGPVPDSVWFASDLMLGAGMVVIQPSTGKVVVLREPYRDSQGKKKYSYFLPKGRKDIGESLEQTALREAYEETGLRVSFLPIVLSHNAPEPLHLDLCHMRPCTEPIFVSMMQYGAHEGGRNRCPGEYQTFWYVGQVSEDTHLESGTRMPDEVDYETCFMTLEEANSALYGVPRHICNVAYWHWQVTVKLRANPRWQEYIAELTKQETRLLEGSADEAGGTQDEKRLWDLGERVIEELRVENVS